MIFRTTITIATLMLFISLSAESRAYQEIEVANGGTVQGKAIMTGKMPFPRVYHLILFPNTDMCSEIETDDEMNRVLDDFKISEDGGLKDVVITLEHIEAGKPFNKEPIMINSEDCKFSPDVNAARQGEAFQVNNLDAVMHNSQVYQAERGKIIQNLPVPPEAITNGKVTFQKKFKIFQMICGMHEFMQTWGYRVQNPYYFITKLGGEFKINNIPSGDYVLNAWHYLMKPNSQKISITQNETISVNFKFDASKIERPLYETITSGRIKKDAAYPGTAKGQELGR